MGYAGYNSSRSPRGEELMEKWGLESTRYHGGHVRIRGVKCGKKGCTKCPHTFYAYHVDGYREKYLGVCDADGNPRKKRKKKGGQ